MNYRLNVPAIVLAAVFVLGAAALFGYTWYSSHIQNEAMNLEDTSYSGSTTTSNIQIPSGEIITTRHYFKDGMHVIAGQIPFPTPCYTLTAEPFFVSGNTNVEIRLTSKASTTETCAQVVTPITFKATFQGPPKITITGTLDNKPLHFNIIEVTDPKELDTMPDEYFKG